MNSSDLIAKLRSRKGEAITRVERLMDEAASHIEAQSKALEEMRKAIEQYDFINEERWGDDDKQPPTWEEVRDKHLSNWGRKNMTFEFWSDYMQCRIIDLGRDACRLLASHSKEGEQG